MVGECRFGAPIDREIGDMVLAADAHSSNWTSAKQFAYVRYNSDISQTGLNALSLGNLSAKTVRVMDSVQHIEDIQLVGKAYAQKHVRPSYFFPTSLQAPFKLNLPPRFIDDHGNRIGEIQAAASRQHRDTDALLVGYAAEELRRQSTALGAEHKHIALDIGGQVVPLRALGRDSKQPSACHAFGTFRPTVIDRDGREFVIIESGAEQLLILQRKTQGFDQMQPGARIGAEADDVAGVGRNFRLIEDDVEHGACHKSACRCEMTAHCTTWAVHDPIEISGFRQDEQRKKRIGAGHQSACDRDASCLCDHASLRARSVINPAQAGSQIHFASLARTRTAWSPKNS